MTGSQTINDEYKFYLLKKRRVEGLLVSAFRGLREHGIEPILIKGWAAARNYPPNVPRFSGDIDLAVSASDYTTASRLVTMPGGIAGVDLHRELRDLDTLGWEKLFADSDVVDLDGEKIRVLSAEDHLRVLIMHWLTDGGENKARLWDIVYAVRNRPDGFDWSRCLEVVSPVRQSWIVTTIGVAHKYLDLELDGLPFADRARDVPDWVSQCLEKAWAQNSPMLPLHTQLRSPGSFFAQLRRRLPPNPIQSTVNCEAGFSNGSRIGYQVRDVFKRLVPSFHRISIVLSGRSPHDAK